VLLLAAAGAATLKLLGGTRGTAALASASSDSVALISPASGHVQASFPVGGNPSSLAVSGGAVWALNADDQTVTRIDLSSHVERPIGTDGIPVDLAAGDGSVWVVNAAGTSAPTAFPGAAPTPFPEPTSVARLDPASALPLLPSIPLPRTVASSPPGSYQIAVGPHGVWVIDADGSVSRIDPASNRVMQTVHGVNVSAIASGAEGTWAIEQNTSTGSIVQLSAERRVVRRVQERIRRRLRELGISPRTARPGALLALVITVPAPILAELLGYHNDTTNHWRRAAAGAWARYASLASTPTT
jgi:hypothetical protein